MRSAVEIRTAWLASLFSTESADRTRTESALRDLYTSAGLAPPEHFFWFDSPFGAAWAVALLCEPHDFIWQRIIADVGRRKRECEYMDRVRASLCKSAGQPDWKTTGGIDGRAPFPRPNTSCYGAPYHLSNDSRIRRSRALAALRRCGWSDATLR
jgi:hypothetical protein